MLTFREGWRSFREGIDRRFIWEYLVAVKNHAWEIFWGASVIGIICTVYTLYFSPSLAVMGWAIAGVFLISGYYAWRADHIRLIPKLGIGDPTTIYIGMGVPDKKRKFVQIPVNCETEGPVKNCKGQLLRVSKWVKSSDGHDGQWETTHIDETLDLLWSFVDEPSITLEHGASRRLNMFFVENTSRNMTLWNRLHGKLTSAPLDHFKFDVRIAGEDCPPVYISVEVTTGNQWDDLTDICLERIKDET
jgi:hypothetical protein